jgi:hypothetical protein
MRLPNEPTNKGLCNKMQTAEQFLTWYLDEHSKEIDFAKVEKNLFSLPKQEQDRIRRLLTSAKAKKVDDLAQH